MFFLRSQCDTLFPISKLVLLSLDLEFYHILYRKEKKITVLEKSNKEKNPECPQTVQMILFGVHKLECFSLNSVCFQPKAIIPHIFTSYRMTFKHLLITYELSYCASTYTCKSTLRKKYKCSQRRKGSITHRHTRAVRSHGGDCSAVH